MQHPRALQEALRPLLNGAATLPPGPARAEGAALHGRAVPIELPTGGGGGGHSADDDDGGLDDADLPSDLELALISLRSDLLDHPGSASFPPLVLRSQLAMLLQVYIPGLGLGLGSARAGRKGGRGRGGERGGERGAGLLHVVYMRLRRCALERGVAGRQA